MDIAKLRERMREFDALRDTDKIQSATIDGVEPQFADRWPAQLLFQISRQQDSRGRARRTSLSVRNALKKVGVSQLYSHQYEAITRSLRGADVVLESPTASGKTVSFMAPLLYTIARDRDSHALMIYPMKALAFDQWSQIKELCKVLSIESHTYDGDTPKQTRDLVRKNPPPILLTNPEYLNASFLGWCEQWKDFLQNLKYVVIDEMHEYRGFFGGNMALLLRRFFLHLNRIGASPRIFLSTATCHNPAEHAKNLVGRDVEVVSARNAMRPRRHFMFVKPDIPEYQYWEILRLRVVCASLAALAEGLQILVFCPTKRFLEEAFRDCRRKAEDLGLDPSKSKLSAFHADLKGDDRQEIQRRVRSGEIAVVFATNALELGVDIGGLDGIILSGFPPNTMSAWQQIGRAGRRWDKDAFVLFYAMNDPIDRFFVGNMKGFLNKPLDELVVDPDNDTLIENHLAMLIHESDGNTQPSDEAVIGSAFYNAVKDCGKPMKVHRYRPHQQLKMRGGMGKSFDLRINGEDVGQISAMRRFREAYIGSVFTFFGRKYRVRSHEEKTVILEDVEQYRKTEAGFFNVVTIADVFDGVTYDDLQVYYGAVNLVINFTGYKLIDERTGEATPGGLSQAHYENNLHAFWMSVPTSAGSHAVGAIGGLEHLIRVGAMFVLPADRFDTSTYSIAGETPTAFYYENYSGGIGLARKLFGVWKAVLTKGVEVAEGCACRHSCPNCIEPAKSYDISAKIDKVHGVELAKSLLAETDRNPTGNFRNGRIVAVSTERG